MNSPNFVKKGQIFMCRFEDFWALCDMIKAVSLDRLQLPFCGRKNLRESFKTAILDENKFAEICSIAKNIF